MTPTGGSTLATRITNMKWIIFIKPALRILDTALDGLVAQIKAGRIEDALKTIEEVRAMIREALKKL